MPSVDAIVDRRNCFLCCGSLGVVDLLCFRVHSLGVALRWEPPRVCGIDEVSGIDPLPLHTESLGLMLFKDLVGCMVECWSLMKFVLGC